MDDPRLSQPIYDEVIEERMPITLRDSVVLDAWVLRPRTPDGVTVPAILILSPYNGSIGEMDRKLVDGIPRAEYVARGYAIVTVSVRGTAHSGGCVEFQGAHERDDYYDVVDAIIGKPWSNGAVGSTGLSWEGTVPNAALLARHPALRTIVPIAAITDWHRWPFLNGVQWYYVAYVWNLYGGSLLAYDTTWRREGDGLPHFENHTIQDDAAALAQRACPSNVQTQYEGLASGPTGTRSAWWDERDFTRYLEPPDRPTGVLVVHGWQDVGVRTDHLAQWLPSLVSAGYETRAVIGQWGHSRPDDPQNKFNIPTDQLRLDSLPMPIWRVTMLRWFDYWLKGVDTGILDMPPVLTQDESWAWHEEDAFVPSRATTSRLYLDTDEKLTAAPGAGLAEFSDLGAFPSGSGPHGSEAAYYTTPPLSEPLRYMGTPQVHLDLTHNAPSGHVGVTFYDVSDEGWRPIHFGFAAYALRNGPYSFEPVVPGQPFSVSVPVLPYDVVIPAGHRLGVAIGNQAQLDPYFQENSPYLPPPSGGTTVIRHGGGSYLELETLDGIDRVVFPGEPARPS